MDPEEKVVPVRLQAGDITACTRWLTNPDRRVQHRHGDALLRYPDKADGR